MHDTPDFFLQRIPQSGKTYREFMDSVRDDLLEVDASLLDEQELALRAYTALNLKRSARIDRTYAMNGELAAVLRGIDEPQLWMVLTEGWCGDSAQILPYLAAMAAASPMIDFRVLERDDYLGIMDRYLTDGTRSIPKLVIFDGEGRELATWGPRPRSAAALIQALKRQNLPRSAMYEQLHLWYGRNRGREIEAEMTALLAAVPSRSGAAVV